MRQVVFVAGARPNFMKIAPVLHAIDRLKPPFTPLVVHTGQHYSPEMSDVFFQQLGITKPNIHLDVGSGTHGQQTACVLETFERFLLETHPMPVAVVVVGDVNSTLAGALASVKLGVPVVHLEAGLRSLDRSMPEEINRLATDAISDLLLVSEPSGETNLRNEGVPAEKIRYVGNVMIDTLVQHLPAARVLKMAQSIGLDGHPFALVTLHRPSNVDTPDKLSANVDFLKDVSKCLQVVFPVHPRTRKRLEEFELLSELESENFIHLLPPIGYHENLSLMQEAKLVLTDSGGIQEETSYLGVPCITLRDSTERPVTLTNGTNALAGGDLVRARTLVQSALNGQHRDRTTIPGWDGHAAERVVEALIEICTS